MSAQPQPAPMKPSRSHSVALTWMRENLFSTWYNSLLTVVSLWFVYFVLRQVAEWAFFHARWQVIPANLRVFLIGTYPSGEVWRIWTVVGTLALLAGLSAGAHGGKSARLNLQITIGGALLVLLPFTWPVRFLIAGNIALLWVGYLLARGRKAWRAWIAGGWFLSFPWTMFLLWGLHSSQLLPRVETTAWGGLTLTLVLAVVGITLSLPIGILLALGRRSSLPAVSIVCASFIEVVRGMPLVTILFMAHLMVPIFLPDFRIDKVVRAMIGLTIFTSAYMAENVRGGLQGIPKGQYEAAEALGMSGTLTTLLIILPQALRAVLPSIVGQFISLFKDTSLVTIIGLLDLLGIARSVMANPNWLGLHIEVYLFVAAVYWFFCYTLSNSSQRWERRLGVRER